MRRRLRRGRLTDQDHARLLAEATGQVATALPDSRDPRRPALLAELLAEHDTDPIAAIQARRRLRRGRRGA